MEEYSLATFHWRIKRAGDQIVPGALSRDNVVCRFSVKETRVEADSICKPIEKTWKCLLSLHLCSMNGSFQDFFWLLRLSWVTCTGYLLFQLKELLGKENQKIFTGCERFSQIWLFFCTGGNLSLSYEMGLNDFPITVLAEFKTKIHRFWTLFKVVYHWDGKS